MRFFTKLFSSFAVMTLGGVIYADVELVKDGKPVAEIVLSENAISSVKLAAEDLQKHLELISGAKLPIVMKPSDSVKNHVYVGESEYTKKLGISVDDLKPEGFKIIVKDNYLALVGRDEQRQQDKYDRRSPNAAKMKEEWRKFAGDESDAPSGGTGPFNSKLNFHVLDATATFYAEAEFLEQLGVRWYNPYENGTVIPSMKNVVATEQSIKKEPKFSYRSINYYNAMKTDVDGILWFKRLKFGSSNTYYFHAHSTRDILTPEQEKLHPEYYAMANGKKIPGRENDGVPHITDPAFRKAAINYMNKAFETYPNLVTFTLGMPDGFTQIDERDVAVWNRPDRGYNGAYSDYVWDFWLFAAKELKASHPDKYLTCYSYTTYAEPPSQVDKLPDNVALFMSYGVSLSMLPAYKYYKDLRDTWLTKLTSKKLFLYDFCLYYRKGAPTCPVFFSKILQEDMQKLNGVCEGKDIEVMPWTKNGVTQVAYPGLTHMLHYLQGKLYWDPNLDLKKLYNEYYELYFGPAKAEMKEFYEFGEEVWTRPETRSITPAVGFLKEKDVPRYFDILKRAREKAGKDTVYDKRIAQIENEMEPLKKLFASLQRTGPEFRCFNSGELDKLDGDLDKPFWNSFTFGWYNMSDLVTGAKIPDPTSTKVSFRFTKSNLIIGVKCFEPNMDKVLAKAKNNDDPGIFNDDVVEVYLETPERSFFKIAVNSNGAVWDESQDSTIVERDTLPILWNPGTKAAVKKEKDFWSVEIVIPSKDFGTGGPYKPSPWGINVCRSRFAGGKPEGFAISPTGKPQFLDLSKMGNLYIRQSGK
jgi:hypothetical protein